MVTITLPCVNAAIAPCNSIRTVGAQGVRAASLSSSAASLSQLRSLRASQRAVASPKRGFTPAYCKVSVGDQAPDLSLKDQNGRAVSLSKLRGKNVVLYFYPADDTPGCTKQACSFRDSFEEFRKLGAEVVGISGDTPESHKAFAEKYDLPYRLLSDEGNAVRKEWGVPSDLFGVLPGRQTYVIDKKGVVQLIFNNQFQPEKHIAQTIALLEDLKADDKTSGGFRLPFFN